MADLKNFFKITFTLLGAVIGAGFVSGREILTFFYGYDVFLSVTVFSVLFCVVLFILFFDKDYTSSKWFAAAKPLIYIGNLLLMSGMLSAIDGLFGTIFCNIPDYKLASAIFAIFSLIVVSDGIEGVKWANAVLTPVIMISLIVALSFAAKTEYSYSGEISVVKIAEYVGLNVFTSSVLFAELGKSGSKRILAVSAIAASVALACAIFVTYSALTVKADSAIYADIPLLSVLSNVKAITWVYYAVLAFGIFTTLLSCHYPLYELVGTKKCNFIPQILLLATAYAVSRLGFYNIVSYLYPVIGGVGFAYISVTSILRSVFQAVRRKNTSAPPKYKV